MSGWISARGTSYAMKNYGDYDTAKFYFIIMMIIIFIYYPPQSFAAIPN